MMQTAAPLPTIKFRCARCQQLLRVPGESLGNNARCPECQLLMQIPEPRAKSAAAEDDDRPGLPWEQRPRKGIGSLLRTALLVSFKPSEAFSQMKQQGSSSPPMLYSAVWYAAGLLGMVTWDTIITVAVMTASGNSAAEIQLAVLSLAGMLAGYLLIGAPLMATLGNLMNAGILHICLIIAGGSRRPFATTFRIACYTQSSLMWLGFVPFGMLAVGIWSVFLNIFAIHKAHEVPLSRAVLAAVLPIVALFVIGLLAVAIFFGGLFWMLMQG